MQPMPLPHFLVLILVVVLAAALTLLLAFEAGVPLALVGLGALLAAGVLRLLARVE